jgi:alcohol dehydrogenase (cytochrome c)
MDKSRTSGALLWKTPVGEHNGHDNDSLLALSHQITLKFPYTVAPGSLGGILSDMAVAGGSVYAATVSNDLLFTTLYNGVLVALNRNTGAIVYRRQLPTSANAPIAVFGNTVLVPAGGPKTSSSGGGGHPQLVAYTVP